MIGFCFSGCHQCSSGCAANAISTCYFCIAVLSFPCKYLLLFTLLLLLYQEHNRGCCCFIYRLVDETKAINSEGGIFSYL